MTQAQAIKPASEGASEVLNFTETHSGRILLVVSDPMLHLNLSSRMRLSGFEVLVTSSGEVAKQRLHSYNPQAIIVDLMVDDGAGDQAIKALRSDREAKSLPIYAFSSAPTERVSRKASRVGATKMFVDGITPLDDLMKELTSTFARRATAEDSEPESFAEGETLVSQGELHEALARVTRHLEILDKAKNNQTRAAAYGELRAKLDPVLTLSRGSVQPGLQRLALSVHALLKVLHEMPECATESTRRTVTTAIDVLTQISEENIANDDSGKLDLYAVVADNDLVSRSVVCSALRSVGFRFECFSHGSVVLRYLDNHKADLAIVHLIAGTSNDKEFGKTLRKKSANAHMPVVFVSGVSDFENQSLPSNGVDEVITKPFIFMELSVKSLSLALKKRLAVKRATEEAARAAEEAARAAEAAAREAEAEALRQAELEQETGYAQAEDDSVQLGDISNGGYAADAGMPTPPKLPSSRFKGSSISASMSASGGTEMVSLREELEQKKQEREKLVSRIFNNELELEQIRASLDEEREHRQQLEQMVQDLMVGQAAPKSPDDSAVDGDAESSIAAPHVSPDAPPPELVASLQSQLAEMFTEAESLRAELEAKQGERDSLATRIFNDEMEIEAIRAQLEEEKARRAQLETHLQDGGHGVPTDYQIADAGQVAADPGAGYESLPEGATSPTDQVRQLREQQEELLKQLTNAQEESEAEFKNRAELEVRVQELSDELTQAREALQNIEVERQQLEQEFNQKLEEVRSAAEAGKAALEREDQQTAQLQQELEAARQRQAELEGTLANAEKAATEHAQLKERLEQQLAAAAEKLAAAEAEREKLTAQQSGATGELEQQLGELKAAAEAAEAARNEEVQRRNELQKELDALWKSQEELDQQLASEKRGAADAQAARAEVEARLKDLSEQLDQANSSIAAAEEKARQESTQREELAAQLEQVRSELASRIAAQNELANEAGEQKASLEERLKKLEAELPQARKKIAELTQEKETIQRELAEQLKAATQAASTAESKARTEAERGEKLQSELEALRNRGNDLNSRLEAEQKRAQEAVSAREATEQRMRDNQAQIDRTLAERQSLVDQHKQVEGELTVRLQSVEQTLKQRVEDLAQARAHNEALANEKRTTEESFSAKLEQASTETAKVRSDLESVTGQKNDLVSQLDALRQTHEGLQARLDGETKSLTEARARGQQLETRLGQAEVAVNELKSRLATEVEAAAKVAQQKAGLEQRLAAETQAWSETRTSFENQLAARQQREAELEQELETQRSKASQAEIARKKEFDRANKFEAEITQLWQVRDDLKARVAAHQKMVADLTQERNALSQQLAETGKVLEQSQREVETLKQIRTEQEGQNRQLAEQKSELESQLAVRDEKQRTHEAELASMDRRVRETLSSLSRTTAELETERGERRRIEQRAAGLSSQLQELHRELNSHLEIEKDNQARIVELEQDIAERVKALAAERTNVETERSERRKAQQHSEGLQEQLDTLRAELAERLKLEKELHARIGNLEEQLRAREESLVRVTQHLENERAERRRVEQRAEALIAQTQQLQDQLGQASQREKENQNRISQLEGQNQDQSQEISRLESGLGNERGERRKVEERAQSLSVQLQELHKELKEHLRIEKEAQSRIAQLEGELEERQDEVLRVRSDLDKELADRGLAEEQLRAAGDISGKLSQYHQSFDEARKAFENTQRELEARLAAANETLQDRQSFLDRAAAEKSELAKALEAMRQELQAKAQQHAIELSKLESALQVESMERRRLEGDVMNSRYASLQSNRSGRALVNSFRRQLDQPVHALMTQARRILAFEMDASMKEIAEALLQSAVSLQNRVRDCDVQQDENAPSPQAYVSEEGDTEFETRSDA